MAMRKAERKEVARLSAELVQVRARQDRVTSLIRPDGSQDTDDWHIEQFACAMSAKMSLSRSKGRSGWDNPDVCSIEYLAEMLCSHVLKGDPVDIGNFAMMLHQRDPEGEESYSAIAAASSKILMARPQPSADVACPPRPEGRSITEQNRMNATEASKVALPKQPEPHRYQWSALDLRTIEEYGDARVAQAIPALAAQSDKLRFANLGYDAAIVDARQFLDRAEKAQFELAQAIAAKTVPAVITRDEAHAMVRTGRPAADLIREAYALGMAQATLYGWQQVKAAAAAHEGSANRIAYKAMLAVAPKPPGVT